MKHLELNLNHLGCVFRTISEVSTTHPDSLADRKRPVIPS
jgi:hypothetical protein